MPFGYSKRHAAIMGAKALGILRSLEFWQKRSFSVLNYHRILPPNASLDEIQFDDQVYTTDADGFREQVRWLSEHRRVLSLSGLDQIRESKQQLPDYSTVITFDDGYEDNYSVAFPILEEFGLTAIFFVPTKMLVERELGWWDKIAFAVKMTELKSIDISYPVRRVFSLADKGRDQIIGEMLASVKSTKKIDFERFVSELFNRTEITPPSSLQMSSELLTKENLVEMASAGMDIGSHAHSHEILTTLSIDERQEEFTKSKNILEECLGKEITALSYPVGDVNHYDRLTIQLAIEAGFEYGFNFKVAAGLNRIETIDWLDIDRISVEWPSLLQLRAASTAFLT